MKQQSELPLTMNEATDWSDDNGINSMTGLSSYSVMDDSDLAREAFHGQLLSKESCSLTVAQEDDETTVRSIDSLSHGNASPATTPLRAGFPSASLSPLPLPEDHPQQLSAAMTDQFAASSSPLTVATSSSLDTDTQSWLQVASSPQHHNPQPLHHFQRVNAWDASGMPSPYSLTPAMQQQQQFPAHAASAVASGNRFAAHSTPTAPSPIATSQETRPGYPPMSSRPNSDHRWPISPASGSYVLPPLRHHQQQQQSSTSGTPSTIRNQTTHQFPRTTPQGHLTTASHGGLASLTPTRLPFSNPAGASRHARNGSWGSTTSVPDSPRSGNAAAASYQPRGHSNAAGSGSGVSFTGAGSRSPSEVLKTLLRKKACLYEPDTSRAIALITWLVGRELALAYGYFSRQQLQVGVHACVTDKIEAGIITRTKVNRCMQIILNSCFHYIIPRPDGTEENGDRFRQVFASETQDDRHLLKTLPVPWNDAVVDADLVLEAVTSERLVSDHVFSPKASPANTPACSPRVGPLNGKGSPNALDASAAGEALEDECDSKRAVMLCFNENVRSAVDVFRCHNEFIRDAARSSQLQLSFHEWLVFFGKSAATAPTIWASIGIPVGYNATRGSAAQPDALGMMVQDELAKFRTSWCNKRYDHDHEMCGFAHAEVNGGWLRRNPQVYDYRDEICPAVTSVTKTTHSNNRAANTSTTYIVNQCPHGVRCKNAHSAEEIRYHPRRYKTQTCSHVNRGCHQGEVCAAFHPVESYRFPKKQDLRSHSHRHHHFHQHHSSARHAGADHHRPVPTGSPSMYIDPAPLSDFEKQFTLPGLQQLFRTQCAVLLPYVKNSTAPSLNGPFSYFSSE
jgi:hypothetical protein